MYEFPQACPAHKSEQKVSWYNSENLQENLWESAASLRRSIHRQHHCLVGTEGLTQPSKENAEELQEVRHNKIHL